MPANRKTVLLLEDEPLIAMAMEDLIRDLGFAPEVVSTNDEALLAIGAGRVDLAILDYKIRDQDSEPVALALRQRSLPFLVCSGTVPEGLTEAFSAAPLVSKPFTDAQLQAAVLALIGG